MKVQCSFTHRRYDQSTHRPAPYSWFSNFQILSLTHSASVLQLEHLHSELTSQMLRYAALNWIWHSICFPICQTHKFLYLYNMIPAKICLREIERDFALFFVGKLFSSKLKSVLFWYSYYGRERYSNLCLVVFCVGFISDVIAWLISDVYQSIL